MLKMLADDFSGVYRARCTNTKTIPFVIAWLAWMVESEKWEYADTFPGVNQNEDHGERPYHRCNQIRPSMKLFI